MKIVAIIVLLNIVIIPSISYAQWMCHKMASERMGNTIYSCGVAIYKTEAEAREMAYINAMKEFNLVCNSSFDCKRKEHITEPLRNDCKNLKDGSYKCYRGVKVTIIDVDKKIISDDIDKALQEREKEYHKAKILAQKKKKLEELDRRINDKDFNLKPNYFHYDEDSYTRMGGGLILPYGPTASGLDGLNNDIGFGLQFHYEKLRGKFTIEYMGGFFIFSDDPSSDDNTTSTSQDVSSDKLRFTVWNLYVVPKLYFSNRISFGLGSGIELSSMSKQYHVSIDESQGRDSTESASFQGIPIVAKFSYIFTESKYKKNIFTGGTLDFIAKRVLWMAGDKRIGRNEIRPRVSFAINVVWFWDFTGINFFL